MKKSEKNIVFFEEVGRDDVALVGGKGANLGEMTNAGVPVPPGFIVTSAAYFKFLKRTSLIDKIKRILNNLDIDDSKKLQRSSERIKVAILSAKLQEELVKEIKAAYITLSGNKKLPVAVRSSATSEDLPEASFAGQQATFLDVVGERNVVKAVQKCWASLFEARAIFYRERKGFSHFKVGIAVPVQKMVEAEVSGIMFTLDPVSNDKKKVIIEAGYGLGQPFVSGEITPDQYVVNKRSLEILSKTIVEQTWQLVKNKHVPISKAYRKKQKLSNTHIKRLAELGINIEKHYKHPQDIEWALEKKKLLIVQTRPVTTLKIHTDTPKISFVDTNEYNKLLQGLGASPGIASGKVKLIKSAKEINKVKEGDILVTEMTDPDFVPAMQRAIAVVTDEGGRTSHAAIVSRELGTVCVVGTTNATTILKQGEMITVDGTEGIVYEGKVAGIPEYFEREHEDNFHVKTATKLYVNLAEPEIVPRVAKKNVDGVGLLRAEFMIAQIGTHPREMIARGKKNEFIKRLAEGIETFCSAFNPKPVIYRATDFKTSEYRHLKGGEKYEKVESNPLIGFRGCFRYITDDDVFNLELDAIKRVRKKYKNLHLMIPFVHTVEELKKVKKILNRRGLQRRANFQLWMMVEIPSNVILLEEFIKVGIDGVSIGSNDLTMTILGVDRDNPAIASVYDERNPAVLWALEKTIKTAHKFGITCSICGQAPSFFPDLTEKLVGWGITSISINPDVINKTRLIISAAERKLVKKRSKRRPS